MFCLLQSSNLFIDCFVRQTSLYYWKYFSLKCKYCFLIQMPCVIYSNLQGSYLGLISSSVTFKLAKISVSFQRGSEGWEGSLFFQLCWQSWLQPLLVLVCMCLSTRHFYCFYGVPTDGKEEVILPFGRTVVCLLSWILGLAWNLFKNNNPKT